MNDKIEKDNVVTDSTIEKNVNIKASPKRRIYLLDILRGILIIYVVYYHFMYDLNDIVGIEIPYLYSKWFSTWRDCMSGTLIFIAGISCNLTRSNIKRGVRTIFVAMMITLITGLIIPDQMIVFGILHFMGSMMLLYGLVALLCGKIFGNNGSGLNNKTQSEGKSFYRQYVKYLVIGLLLLAIFFATFDIYYGYVGLFGAKFYLPKELYGSFFMFIMGFRGPFMSADYYPIIPWCFLFLSGSMLGRIVKCKTLPDWLYKNYCKPLAVIGGHTMLIYIVHQPLLLGLAYLLAFLR